MEENVVQQGKALALTIQGLQALEDTGLIISVAETQLRPQLIKNYQRTLKQLLVQVSPEAAAEILMMMRTLDPPPIHDLGLN